MAPRQALSAAIQQRSRSAAIAVGHTVRALRVARGWTIEQAAENTGVDPRHLQRIEKGRVATSLATLLRVADSLQVALRALVVDVVPVVPEELSVAQADPPAPEPRSPSATPVEIDDLPRLIGRKIALLRRERGWTQAQLAARSALTEPYLQRIERGRQNPSIKVLARIAGALDLPVTDLLRLDV